jgi:hypothetical protein
MRGTFMSQLALLAPLLVQVVLTLVLIFWMSLARAAAVYRGEARSGGDASPRTAKIAEAYTSQTELPVLFYVLTVLAMLARRVDFPFLVLAWIFVASRILHAYILIFADELWRRFYAFFFGAVVLALMWAIFIAALITGRR